VKLPKLSADELRALYGCSSRAEKSSELAHRVKSNLVVSLPSHVGVIVEEGVVTAPTTMEAFGPGPKLHADNDLLVAWVAARFGSNYFCTDVPTHYGESLLTKISLALAETVLRRKLTGVSTRCLEIRLDGRLGKVALDWSDMNANTLMKWALMQWNKA
jgi:hypothetical protein